VPKKPENRDRRDRAERPRVIRFNGVSSWRLKDSLLHSRLKEIKMGVGSNNRKQYYGVDCKRAIIVEKLGSDYVKAGDFYEGRISSIELSEWQHEGNARFSVKIGFDSDSEILSFNAQTTFGRMIVGRMADYTLNNRPIIGQRVRITPYFYVTEGSERCCGAIRVNGEKYSNSIQFVKPVTVTVGKKQIIDDSNVIAQMSVIILEMANARLHSSDGYNQTESPDNAIENDTDNGVPF